MFFGAVFCLVTGFPGSGRAAGDKQPAESPTSPVLQSDTPLPENLKTVQAPAIQKAGLPAGSILVDDFEIGQTQGLFAERKNRLDAFQGTWARRPSYTVITKESDSRPGRAGKVLRIDFSKQGGWCGWYTLLNGVDVSGFNALTFWVKGETGGERFDIGLADNTMQDLEIDAVYLGSIKSFIPQGITTEWQQVKVPIAALRSELKMDRMGSLVFWFRYEGSGAILMDDIAFVEDPEVQRIIKENAPRAVRKEKVHRSMWVWKYDLVNNLEARQELFDFCGRTAIETVYVYLGEEPISAAAKTDQAKFAELMKEAHAAGLRVEALQGNPLWALKSYHHRAIRWVKGYLTYNQGRPPEERIDGVHLDIEPYLTAEWETGDQEKLKSDFLELMGELRRMIAEMKGDQPFDLGLAIPLFYDRDPVFEKALFERVDYVGLMDYFDTATDIVEAARSHIKLAEAAGKRVAIGVETQDLVQMNQGKRRNTFFEEGWQEMEGALDEVAAAFSGSSAFKGVAIHAYYSYRILQKGRNVPTRERSEKVPRLTAVAAAGSTVVDGDLSEWKAAEWLPLRTRDQVVYGAGAWLGPQDISFKAALEWEPRALLMAVEATDDQVVQEARGKDMWEGDHLEVWVDADLAGDYSEAVNSADDFQFGFSPGNFGTVPAEAFAWVPTVPAEMISKIQIASRKTETGYTMEIRIPTEILFQGLGKRVGVEPVGLPPALQKLQPQRVQVLTDGTLQAGFQMGIMIDGSDTDRANQPQKCLLSSSPERQWGDPTTFNILELK